MTLDQRPAQSARALVVGEAQEPGSSRDHAAGSRLGWFSRRHKAQGLSLAFAALLIESMIVGCSSGSGSVRVRLDVTTRELSIDQVAQVGVVGAPLGQHVTLSTTTIDGAGVTWAASAVYLVGGEGRVDTTSAPISGSYHGAHPMGLFWSMRPVHGDPQEVSYDPPRTVEDARLSAAIGDRVLATTSLRRYVVAPGITERQTTVPTAGFVGSFFAPPKRPPRRPAVLTLGGSEGGLSTRTLAAQLAAAGYPTLALAYFDAPGLPKRLERIPLEYFVRALQWLGRQPDVDPTRITVIGASRGSEAALLLGSYYPNLVHAVVAGSPSSVIGAGFPDAGQPAWLLKGRPLPYHPDVLTTDPDDSAVAIPVEHIAGTALLICGEDDQLWPSCRYTDAIVARLKTRPGPAAREAVLRYPGAGHKIGSLVPYLPSGGSFADEGRINFVEVPKRTRSRAPTRGLTSWR